MVVSLSYGADHFTPCVCLKLGDRDWEAFHTDTTGGHAESVKTLCSFLEFILELKTRQAAKRVDGNASFPFNFSATWMHIETQPPQSMACGPATVHVVETFLNLWTSDEIKGDSTALALKLRGLDEIREAAYTAQRQFYKDRLLCLSKEYIEV